jgi:hypothetical protein
MDEDTEVLVPTARPASVERAAPAAKSLDYYREKLKRHQEGEDELFSDTAAGSSKRNGDDNDEKEETTLEFKQRMRQQNAQRKRKKVKFGANADGTAQDDPTSSNQD